MKRRLMMTILMAFGFLYGGCSNKNPVKPDPLLLVLKTKPVSYVGAGDGAIDLTITGGTPPYEIAWSNGATTEDIEALAPGMYRVTVTDAEEEVVRDSVALAIPREGRLTDVDGNVYRTIKIGDQWWMAENLRTTHDAQGNAVESVVMNNDEGNLPIYGRLYTWDAVMNGETQEGAQGIAPAGWHIPTRQEWMTLINHLGGLEQAGGKLKEVGTSHWADPNVGATNSSGFTARGGGELDEGQFAFFKTWALFWTSTTFGTEKAYYYAIAADESSMREITWYKRFYYSVRCIKNLE